MNVCAEIAVFQNLMDAFAEIAVSLTSKNADFSRVIRRILKQKIF